MRRSAVKAAAALLIFFLAFLPSFSCPMSAGEAAAAELPVTWYFAEGTTREGFYEYLSLQNPSDETATVTVNYMTNEGPRGPFELDIPPVSRGTVFVNGYMEAGLDVSAKVECGLGLVAERPMYFVYGEKWEGGHVVEGVTEARRQWYFAEGTTRPYFEEWLSIQNPQAEDLDVTVTYFTPTVVDFETYRVTAEHRFTVNVNHEVARLWPDEPAQDVSVKVEAAEGIIVERPIYFAYKNDWEGGHTVVGETAPGVEWFLAEGYCEWNFETWICILNPGDEPANVTINYRRGDGAPLPEQIRTVAGKSRSTIYVNQVVGKGEFSFHITSDQPIVVERPIYFSYRYMWDGGHNNMASDRAAGKWYLSEGSTRHGIETYLCIFNPRDVEQRVIVNYMLENSAAEVVEFTIPPYSRYTRSVNGDIGQGHDVSCHVIAFKGPLWSEAGEVVVERPMYFLFMGTVPGGHVASGYPAG